MSVEKSADNSPVAHVFRDDQIIVNFGLDVGRAVNNRCESTRKGKRQC